MSAVDLLGAGIDHATAVEAPLWERTRIVVGEQGIERLRCKRVLVVGLGGVGAYAAEALARAGVGGLTLVDGDAVVPSNLNRQLVALRSTIGRRKVDVMAERIADIHAGCQVGRIDRFIAAAEVPELIAAEYDLVLDAIDSLTSKLALIEAAVLAGVPIASSMGAGGRTDPSRLKLGDLMDSRGCPLAREVRQRLRRRGIGRGVLAVWSDEPPRRPLPPEPTTRGRPRAVNGTVSYLPALFGLTLAGAVVHRWLGQA